MTQPKTAFREIPMDTCLVILDEISHSHGRGGWNCWGRDDLHPGEVIYLLSDYTGYSYGTVRQALLTLEAYRMIHIERLSHPYPCQHNFICWVQRLAQSQWLKAPRNIWGRTQPVTTSTQGSRPALTVLQGGLAS